MIKGTVDTCKICRHWTRPSPKAISSHRLSTAFNQVVQWDILFYKSFMISHLCDGATRFSVAVVISDKEVTTIIRSIANGWIRLFGPPKLLLVDGESGLDSEGCRQWLDRIGSEIKTKAPNEHAQMVERHHELFRQTLHRVEDQLNEEGVKVPFDVIVAECIFAKNALLTIGRETPYRAVMGRDPILLRDSNPFFREFC